MEPPVTRLFQIRGVQIQSDYAGPLVVEGFLLKQNSASSMFSSNEYQKRYFYLSVT